MYSFLLAVQYAGILTLVLEIIFVLCRKSTKLQNILLVVLVSTLINFVGYLFEMQATTQTMALQAVKMIYLGKPFIILFILIFFLERMEIQTPGFLYPVLGALHMTVSAMVLTCEHHTLFYSSIGYDEENGLFPHLVLGHSAFYLLYHIIVLSYFVFMFVAGMKALRHTKDKREKVQIICLSAIAAVSVLGLLIFFSGVSGGYDTTIPAYLISTVLLLVLITKFDLLDTLALVKENVMDEFAEGLLVTDQNDKLLYANTKVQAIFPELKEGEFQRAKEQLHDFCASDQKLVVENNIYEIYEKEIIKDDRLYGSMFVVRDVTESHNHAVELKKQTEIAKKANQAKSDFLAKMSHEIRTPINAVLGMNELILRESGEEAIRHYAIDVQNSANTLLGLINDILDTSKIESGKMEIIPVQYELDSLLNDIITMIYVKAKKKDLEFEVSVDHALPNGLVGDDIRIRQILVNLLNNSVKYTQSGKVALHVTGHLEADFLLMHFEVRDTGIGIKEEDLPKLFAAFERIEESKNRNIEGTGLGMNIVFDLLRLMGTELKISSTYGVGSVFSFDLKQSVYSSEPIGDLAERSKELYKEYTYKAAFVAPQAKVLLVDDNDVNRKVFCNLLKETKLQIDDVASGFACLERIQQKSYDIIFMDHMMPEMDGIETFHHMQELEHKSKEAPVIILTANAVAGAKEEYLREGFSDYLSKPVNTQKLENLLQKYLPAHLIQENTLTEVEADASEGQALPDLDEFDWSFAKQYFSDDKTLKQTLHDIYISMDSDMERLQAWHEEFMTKTQSKQAETALENYRITVHAIKSNMAMVGALLVSKLARILEVAALEGNLGRIGQIHPVFLEEMQIHKERMAVLFEESGGKELNVYEVLATLDFLKQSLEEFDYSMADELMERLNMFIYEGEITKMMEKLGSQVLNLQPKEAVQTIQELVRALRKEEG
ncbi:MAG: response regulator [Clostridium sp.]|nr:response regulator [Clostridium sp.]